MHYLDAGRLILDRQEVDAPGARWVDWVKFRKKEWVGRCKCCILNHELSSSQWSARLHLCVSIHEQPFVKFSVATGKEERITTFGRNHGNIPPYYRLETFDFGQICFYFLSWCIQLYRSINLFICIGWSSFLSYDKNTFFMVGLRIGNCGPWSIWPSICLVVIGA